MQNYQRNETTVTELGLAIAYYGSIALIVAGVYGLLFGFS